MIEWIVLVYMIDNTTVPIITQLHKYNTKIECEHAASKTIELPKDKYITIMI